MTLKAVFGAIFASAFAVALGAAVSTGAALAATDDVKGPLVTGEWLEKNLDNPKVKVVEVSVEPGLFEQADRGGVASSVGFGHSAPEFLAFGQQPTEPVGRYHASNVAGRDRHRF